MEEPEPPIDQGRGALLNPVLVLFALGGIGLIIAAVFMMTTGRTKSASSPSIPTEAAADAPMPDLKGPTPVQVNSAPVPAADGPRIRFGTTAIDFGVVPLDTNVNYSFSYANVGAGKLKIGDVSVRVLQGC